MTEFWVCNHPNCDSVDVRQVLHYYPTCGHIRQISSYCDEHIVGFTGTAWQASNCDDLACSTYEKLVAVDFRDRESIEAWLACPNGGWTVPF